MILQMHIDDIIIKKRIYGGENYVRINLATSHEVLSEALQRLKEYVKEMFKV